MKKIISFIITLISLNLFADFSVSYQFPSLPLKNPRGMAWVSGSNTFWVSSNLPDSGPNFALFDIYGNLLDSFTLTDKPFLGLAYDGYYLWAGTGGIDKKIYKIDLTKREFADSFLVPGATLDDITSPFGLAFDGDSLWMISGLKIYKINIIDGKSREVAPSPLEMPQDLELVNDTPWVGHSVCAYTKYIHKLNPTDGTIIESHLIKGITPSGITYDGESFWICNISNNTIYKLNGPQYVNDDSFEIYPPSIFLIDKIIIKYKDYTNTKINVEIQDISGKVVKKFNQYNEIMWDGTDEYGRKLPDGIYFVSLNCKNSINKIKIIKMK